MKALLAVALLVQYALLWPLVRSTHGDFDALHLYLPLARGLLEHGVAFFTHPESLQAPPFSFAYPALLGASLPALKVANAVLAGLTLLLVYRCGGLLHSRAAGVVAAFLFALSPTLRPHLATPITEGPFLFLCALWFWGLGEWLVHRRRGALALSAAALCLAALTRATMFYGLLLLVAAAAVVAWRARGEGRAIARAALLAYGLALLPIAAFIARSGLLFGFGFFTTGGGNALYLGHHPLTGGFDPAYLGLHFDVLVVTGGNPHLLLESERLLAGAARLALGEHDVVSLLQLHWHKLAAFIFVTDAEVDVLQQRAWRAALMALAFGGWSFSRPALLRGALFAMLAFQVVIHVPALYTHRYSVGAMDLWLVLAAAVGATGWVMQRRIAHIAAAVAVTAIVTVAGIHELRSGPRPMPDVFAVPRVQAWQAPPLEDLTHDRPAIEVPLQPAHFDPAMNQVLVLDVVSGTPQGFGCDELAVAHRGAGMDAYGKEIVFRAAPDGREQRLQFGVAPLTLAPEGTLRLRARCGPGSRLRFVRVALYTPMLAAVFRARLVAK